MDVKKDLNEYTVAAQPRSQKSIFSMISIVFNKKKKQFKHIYLHVKLFLYFIWQ